MRESNFAFPAQNKACVCITSQLYDRRALDTTSALPLFNSLTHLTYLTSTSPRIREIMTTDGGLERLVRMLHEFCMCPPPPDNPALFYGLSPPSWNPPRLQPTLNPASFDKHAAYRFSLAFQCVVNIGVRGSEPIRSRVVQAGTLEVVGCILEAWLANKGFAVGPSSSATGMPRETREQRHARRLALQEQRHRDDAVELARALHRQIQVESVQRVIASAEPHLRPYFGNAGPSRESAQSSDTDQDTSTDVSNAPTPPVSGTPTGTVTIPSRDRSGTIIARPVWDQPTMRPQAQSHSNASTATVSRRTRRDEGSVPSSPPTDASSRPDTETEDDDGDVDMDRQDGPSSTSPSPSPGPRHHRGSLGRRAVGIVSDGPTAEAMSTDAHIIINETPEPGVGGDRGVEEGIVSLEPNDDFAMGAPPGAPGAIDETARAGGVIPGGPPDATPRAGVVALPAMTAAIPMTRGGTLRGGAVAAALAREAANAAAAATPVMPTPSPRRHHHHHHHEGGPYRDEDVLLSLQLLAYLSKYPHVRQAFYKPRTTFHPASAQLPGGRYAPSTNGPAAPSSREKEKMPVKDSSIFRAFKSTPKDRQQASATSSASSSQTNLSSAAMGSSSSNNAGPSSNPQAPSRQTNVFSLVERFTFRPSSSESDMPNPPPRLPPEIQYWAGVIMRNACRKDESRGGIRQCANMLCGRWETFPREFAKCRRCRKAKYCGKECQSTAWSEGHRFWCSAKEPGDDDKDLGLSSAHHHHQDGHHRDRHADRRRERTLGNAGFDTNTGGAETIRHPVVHTSVAAAAAANVPTTSNTGNSQTRSRIVSQQAQVARLDRLDRLDQSGGVAPHVGRRRAETVTGLPNLIVQTQQPPQTEEEEEEEEEDDEQHLPHQQPLPRPLTERFVWN